MSDSGYDYRKARLEDVRPHCEEFIASMRQAAACRTQSRRWRTPAAKEAQDAGK